MTESAKTIIYPVRDLTKAKDLFTALLGTSPSMDEPYYVGYDAGGQHIGLDPNGHQRGMTGPVNYWEVSDIRGTVQRLLEAGAQLQEDVKNVGGGRLVAAVRDVDGNAIGLMQSS